MAAKKGKSLEDLAAELGYTCGQYALARIVADIRTLVRWRECFDAGIVPQELQEMSYSEFEDLLRAEERALESRDRALMEYFYGKKRAVESRIEGADGAPVRLIIEGA